MRSASVSKTRKYEVGAAAAVAFGALGAAMAEPAGAFEGSSETSAMIVGPLMQEFGVAGLDARAAARTGVPLALRGDPAPRFTDAPARGEASRFAAEALSARDAAGAGAGVASFSGADATLATTPSGGRVSVSMFDTARPGAAAQAFSPDLVEIDGLRLAAPAARDQSLAVRYEARFDSPGGADGLDVGLAPRAGVSFGDAGPAAEAGATVRLGRYLDAVDEAPSWWFFAGADRQALLYDPSEGFKVRQAFAMQPYAVVGDAQAGVAMKVRGADVSLAYVHRETTYSLPNDSWETSEGFAAFTLTFKR